MTFSTSSCAALPAARLESASPPAMATRRLLLSQYKETRPPAEAFSFAVLDHIQEREDPLFDCAAELGSMLELWRDEIPCHGDRGYNGVRRP